MLLCTNTVSRGGVSPGAQGSLGWRWGAKRPSKNGVWRGECGVNNRTRASQKPYSWGALTLVTPDRSRTVSASGDASSMALTGRPGFRGLPRFWSTKILPRQSLPGLLDIRFGIYSQRQFAPYKNHRKRLRNAKVMKNNYGSGLCGNMIDSTKTPS